MANAPIMIEHDIDELNLFIYVIGYKDLGESIVFIIKDVDIPVFTMVIDSYQSSVTNYTIEILKENNINNVDLLCWTHPDLDHTVGLDAIIKDFCKQTIFVTPEGLRERLIKYPDEEALKILTYIDKTHSLRKEAHKHRVSVANEYEYSQVLTQPLVDISGKKLVLDVKSLAPIYSYIEYYKVNDVDYAKNIYSIVLVVNIGGRKFLFTGDVEDRTIKYMDLEQIEDIFLLKVPHHTSDSSVTMWEYYNNKYEEQNKEIPLAMTSIYKRYGHPNPDMVNRYKRICHNFYCTNIKPDNTEYEHGYICYKSKICTAINYNQLHEDIICYGLAGTL